jgi:hypothetical protein
MYFEFLPAKYVHIMYSDVIFVEEEGLTTRGISWIIEYEITRGIRNNY